MDSIVKETVREVEPLRESDDVVSAARRVIAAELPALPVVDAKGRYAGIFGEREFMGALFPGYVNELASAAMISRRIDDAIERRMSCAFEPISKYLTRDHVAVGDEHSDTQLAELFLHHRVLIIPIATGGTVHGVVTRSDFFAALVERFESASGASQ